MSLATPELDVTIKPHSSLRSVTIQLNRGGVPVEPELFVPMTRALGLSAQLKSGNYAFKAGVTPYEVLQKMITRGDVNEYVATVIEGWTLQKMRAELDGNPALTHDTAGMSDVDLLKAIGATTEADKISAEGPFFPDTYLFDKGTSDLAVYKRAYRIMQQRLNEAWANRVPNPPYKTPYDALIMASIVEKETGRAQDRPLVAAVFANRLRRIGMPLQTDPSVIYGLGSAYGGHLKKRPPPDGHSVQSYTRMGLPLTPIALPGVAAQRHAQSRRQQRAVFRVARRRQQHFSDNLGNHNKAVDKYIRGQ